MRIAFYRAANGGIVDKLINFFTERRGFSHVEFVFSDGVFFSSSGQDGGCRFKEITPKPENWEMFHFGLSASSEIELRQVCQQLVYRKVKYDWLGVLGFVIQVRACPKRLFCSECLVSCLQQIGLLLHIDKTKVSPNDLWQIMEAATQLHRRGVL